MRLLFTFFIILNIFTYKVQATFAADLDAGEQIFSANCAACHANGNNAIMPDKTLKSDALSENSMNSIEAITNQVKNGKNAMPAFGGRLADEDIENVANYVLSKSENGW
uniref:Cytochrome c6 n=1 Tax=Gracilaria firma TaxID=2510791 RepID=A0A1P8D6Q1_9FLOR|nr:cytochrome c553 [Gracilaria firma]YP_009498080.1 PetJ [Gracilaria changii]APR74483.1 cytochrome c553 [Gracilaria firma]ART65343.1 PetJ [Gracilaria changii]|eukprot:TRINITY_DN49288_c0_g1_i1.p2 TRINITY_DN49288_c0_g1~~TRINITY_DN49288_c0_g1_i1.p2  ORF type:complete len:109 (-),score=1.92 TRINITY_DN49288_c0_g1_i1:109-435(-)